MYAQQEGVYLVLEIVLHADAGSSAPVALRIVDAGRIRLLFHHVCTVRHRRLRSSRVFINIRQTAGQANPCTRVVLLLPATDMLPTSSPLLLPVRTCRACGAVPLRLRAVSVYSTPPPVRAGQRRNFSTRAREPRARHHHYHRTSLPRATDDEARLPCLDHVALIKRQTDRKPDPRHGRLSSRYNLKNFRNPPRAPTNRETPPPLAPPRRAARRFNPPLPYPQPRSSRGPSGHRIRTCS